MSFKSTEGLSVIKIVCIVRRLFDIQGPSKTEIKQQQRGNAIVCL